MLGNTFVLFSFPYIILDSSNRLYLSRQHFLLPHNIDKNNLYVLQY